MTNLMVPVHCLPGRTRVRVSIPNLTPAWIEAMFRKIPFIYSATYTQETRSLLLYHDRSITWKDITKYLRRKFLRAEQSEKPKSENVEVKKHLFALGLATAAFLADWLLFPGVVRVGWVAKLLNISALTTLVLSVPIFKNGISEVVTKRRANADTLTTAAVLAAIFKGNPRSALVVVILSTISELLTEYTAHRTRNYIRDMLKLDVPYVWKVGPDGKEARVKIETVRPDDLVTVFLGEKISVDGEIESGVGTVDESSITGEFFPKEVGAGKYVYAGSILKSGSVRIRVKQVGDGTAITRIIKMIEEAQSKQAPIQSQADRLSNALVPVSFLMAILVFFATRNWDRVLNMLFIDFSCGLKLSTATAISASIGKAANQGILIKGGQYLERLSRIDTVVFDKTGTLTEGRPEVKEVLPFNGYTAHEVIRYAASAEEHSSHPIAESILQQAQKWDIIIPPYNELDTIVGRGVRAVIHEEGAGEKVVLVGSQIFLEDSHVDMSALESAAARIQDENVVYVACNGQLIGCVLIHDPVRHGMRKAINRLRRRGVDEVVMLTGDRRSTAHKISTYLSLDSYYAEALPSDKADFVKRYRQKGSSVMMVGDGINDAPALAYADVGVTMGGKRTDIAVEASDVTISSDDPLTLSSSVRHAQRTMKVIHQNFLATIIINSAAMMFGAIGLISPVVGAVIHNAATISVVANSARILLWDIKKERNQAA